ncbi:hypothetical protein PG357_08470 [Riemerella anatipestifer]|nr:hypothetical protein [Riemerella anatipestifer]
MHYPKSEISLEKTLDFYFSIYKRKGLFDCFEGLEDDLVQQYIDLKKDKLNSNIDFYQEFFLNVRTGIQQENYDISWSITKASKLIAERRILPRKVMIKSLYADFTNLEEAKLRHYQNCNLSLIEPIIVSFYLPIQKLIVIDGNHRLHEAFSKGYREIDAVILSPFANSLIMNERSYKLYIFHHNLINLVKLCCDPFAWKFEANNSLDWNTYYGNYEFKNIFFKKLLLLIKYPYFPKAK